MIKTIPGLLLLAIAVALIGCDASDKGAAGDVPGAHDMQGAEGDHGAEEGHDGHEGGHDAAPAFTSLSAADAVLAKAQGTCPVSEEPLGAMGEPVKVTVGDRTLFLCCNGCKKKFDKDPDTYLAKLDAMKK